MIYQRSVSETRGRQWLTLVCQRGDVDNHLFVLLLVRALVETLE